MLEGSPDAQRSLQGVTLAGLELFLYPSPGYRGAFFTGKPVYIGYRGCIPEPDMASEGIASVGS